MAVERGLDLQPGDVIAGKYEVLRELQTGSMGAVYACRYRDFNQHIVAVKVLFPDAAGDQVARARLQQEVFCSYLVTHPNIVRTYEYLHEGPHVGYSMEFIDDGDLADRFERAERFTAERTAHILAQVCRGVQAMHTAGIIHRDLKPENILLRSDGVAKIADFGIVRRNNGPRLTERGGVIGTIAYMSPEYMLGGEVDWRSDIYAIGVLGYEMLTGAPPFRGESAIECMRQRLKNDPPPMSPEAGCPPELEQVIIRALAREPSQRYQSAVEMEQDLQRFLTAAAPEPARAALVVAQDSVHTEALETRESQLPAEASQVDSKGDVFTELVEHSIADEYSRYEVIEIADLYGIVQDNAGKTLRVRRPGRRRLLPKISWPAFERLRARVPWLELSAAILLIVISTGAAWQMLLP